MYTIVIDPGHGGSNSHNRGVSGAYYEHIGNLEFSLKLRDALKQDYNVILTRDHDVGLSLTSRAKIAIQNKALLFISVHSNASSDPSVGGTSVFYSINRPSDKEFAAEIGHSVANAYGISFRGAKVRPSSRHKGLDYYTVINVAANYRAITGNSKAYEVPHVLLIERAFHTNPQEEKLLLDPNVSHKAARAMADVIRKYISGDENTGNIILKKGMKGSTVKQLQENLTELGYGNYLEPYGSDGIFGDATEKAVTAFQKDHGLQQDGIAGPATLDKIAELLNPQTPPAPSIESQIQALTEKLNSLEAQIQALNERVSTIEKSS